MLTHFGLLHEEPFGGTRQRVVPEAEAQSLAPNALVCRERVNSIHGHILLTDVAQNTAQLEKLIQSRTKKPTLHSCTIFPLPKRHREVWTAWVSKLWLRQTLRVCLNMRLKAQTLN